MDSARSAIKCMDSQEVINAVRELKKITCYISNMKDQLKKYEQKKERLISSLAGNNEYSFLPSGNGSCYDDDDDYSDHNSAWGGAGPDCIPGRLEAAGLN